MKRSLQIMIRVTAVFVLLCQVLASPLVLDTQAANVEASSDALILNPPGALQPGYHYVRAFGSTGQPYTPTGQDAYLNQPRGLVMQGSTLYAVESGGSRLWQFSTATTPGTPITPWAPYGVAGFNGGMERSDSVLSNPQDAWKDPSADYLWVNSWMWDSTWITIFNTATGQPLASFRDFINPGGMSLGDTSVNCINGITADPTAVPFRLFVSETCNQNAVLVLAITNPYDNATRTVTLQSVIQGPFYNPRQLILTDLGVGRRLYIAHQNGLAVFAETSPDTWGAYGPSFSGQDLRGLGLNPIQPGAIYAAASTNQGPQVYRCQYPDPDVFFCETYIPSGRDSGSGWIQFLNDPQDVAFDAAGNAYVSDAGRMTIEKFTDPASASAVFYGVRSTSYAAPAAQTPPYYFNTPSGVTIDANHNLYITESAGQRLTKLDPNGAYVASFGMAGSSGGSESTSRLNWPSSAAVDAQGRVYVADHNNSRVVILDGDLTYLGMLGQQPDENYRINCPSGVVVAANGDIFVSDECAHNIQVYTADRVFRSKIGVKYQNGSDNAHFNQPNGLALLDTNTLLVADANNGRVQKCVRTYGSPDSSASTDQIVFTDQWSCSTFSGLVGEGNADPYRFQHPYGVTWDSIRRRVVVSDLNFAWVKVLDENGRLLTTLGEAYRATNDQDHFFNPMGVAVDPSGNLYVADSNNHRVQKYIPALEEIELVGQIGGPIERVVKAGDHLYAKVGARLGVFSLADPAQPALQGLSDLLPGTIFSGPVIQNNLAFVLVSDGTLRIFSLVDPTHPLQVGSLPGRYSNPQGLSVSGNWAFAATCCTWTDAGQTPEMMAIDVSDPANPKLAAVYALGAFANGDNYIQRSEAFAPASGPIQVYFSAHQRGLGRLSFDPTQLPAHPELAFSDLRQFGAGERFTEFVINAAGTTLYAVDDNHLHAVQTSDLSGVGQYNINRNAWVSLDGNLLYLNDGQTLDIYNTTNLGAGAQSISLWTANAPRLSLGQIVPVGTRIYDAASQLGLLTLDYTLGVPNTFTLRGRVRAPAGSPGFLEGIGTTVYDSSWDAGLRILDAANPAQIQEKYQSENFDWGSSYVNLERISDKTYAFLQIGVGGGCALAVLDVTDPLNVTILANSDTGSGVGDGVFGCGPGRMRIMPGPGAANHEWVFMLGVNADATASDLLVFDVDLSSSPVVIHDGVKATILSNQDRPAVWADFYTRGGIKYLLIAERNSGLRVVNVANPASPLNVGIYPGNPNGFEVLNDKAYLSDFNRGLVVLDLANIAAPATLNGLGTYWFDNWTGYPRVKAFGTRSYVYMPNGDRGLRIFDVSDPAHIRLVDKTGDQGGFAIAGYVNGNIYAEAVMSAGVYTYWVAPSTETTLTNSTQFLDSSAIDGITYHLNGTAPAALTLLHMPVYSGNTPAAPAGLRAIGHAYAVMARNPTSDQPVTLLAGGATYTVSLQYTGAEISGLNESSLAFYSWDGAQWVRELSSSVDPVTNTLTATPSHFSLWTVLGSSDATAPIGVVTINAEDAFTRLNAVTLGLTYDPDVALARYQETTSGCSGPSCTWTDWEAAASSRAFTLSAGDGAKTVRVEFQDGAGNLSTGTISDQINLDQTAPTASFALAGGSLTNQTVVTLNNISIADAGSGMIGGGMRFSEKADFSDAPAWLTPAATAPFTLSAGDGLKTIYGQFKDVLGNLTSAEIKASLSLDQTAPTGALYINGGAVVTTSRTVSLTLAAGDNLSGPAKMRFSVDPAFSGVNWVEPYAPASAFDLPAGDGLKTVYAQVQDAAGNISTAAIQATIILDTNPPGSGSVTIDPARKPFSASAVVNLTLAATDAAEMRLSNSSSFPGADATFMPFATSKAAWALTAGDGPKNVYVQYRDSYGLLSPVFSDSTVLDTTAPSAFNLYINGGAALTASTNVNLFLTFTETGSGVSHYRVATSLAGLNAATYVAYANPASYTLSAGDGLKTVCVQVKDAVGNEAAGICKTITLDSTAPTGSIVVNGGARFTIRPRVTLTLAAADVTSPTGLQMLVSNTNSCASGTWQPFQSSLTWNLLPGLGKRTVYVCYRDAAGNVSVPFSDDIAETTPNYLPITRR